MGGNRRQRFTCRFCGKNDTREYYTAKDDSGLEERAPGEPYCCNKCAKPMREGLKAAAERTEAPSGGEPDNRI